MGTTTSALTSKKSTEVSSRPKGSEPPDPDLAQMRSEIANTRADMGSTLEALHGKLNPAVLKEQALDQFHEAKETIKAEVKAEIQEAKTAVREATIGRVETMIQSAQTTVKDTGRSVVDTIRENPIPAALAGVGLVWLFMARDRGRRDIGVRTFGSPRSSDVLHKVGDLAERAQSTIGEATRDAGQAVSRLAHNTGEAVSNLAHETGTAVSDLAHQTGAAVSDLAYGAKEQGIRLENRAETIYFDNPLVVGAAVVAAGTILGLAIPISRREEKWMGEARDEVVKKAEKLAHEAIGKAEDVGKEVVGALSGGDEPQGQQGQQGQFGQQGQDRQTKPSAGRAGEPQRAGQAPKGF